MGFLSALSAVASATSSGTGAAKTAYSGTSGDIVVCPVGVNLGEILKPFVENDTENGGYGYVTPARLAASTGSSTPESIFNSTKQTFFQWLGNPIVLGAALLGGLIFLKGRG